MIVYFKVVIRVKKSDKRFFFKLVFRHHKLFLKTCYYCNNMFFKLVFRRFKLWLKICYYYGGTRIFEYVLYGHFRVFGFLPSFFFYRRPARFKIRLAIRQHALVYCPKTQGSMRNFDCPRFSATTATMSLHNRVYKPYAGVKRYCTRHVHNRRNGARHQ